MAQNANSSRTPGTTKASGTSAPRRKHVEVRTVKRLNRRLILILFVATIVCGASVHALHTVMADRNADDLKERAAVAEEKGEAKTAVRLLSQYLKFEPGDLDAKEKYATLLPDVDDSPRAWYRVYRTLEDVLRKDPENREHLRRPLIDAAMKVGRYSDAFDHIEVQLGKTPGDAELVALKALTRLAAGREREAAVQLAVAVSLDPRVVQPYADLAALLVAKPGSVPSQAEVRKGLEEAAEKLSDAPKADVASKDGHSNEATGGTTLLNESEWVAALFPKNRAEGSADEIADGLLEEMVKRADPEWKAYQARAMHRQGQGDFDGASADLAVALETPQAAQEKDMLIAAAAVEAARAAQAADEDDLEKSEACIAAARRYAETGLKSDASDARYHLLLAEIELAGGATQESIATAERHLREGLAKTEAASEDAAQASVDVDIEEQLRWQLAVLLSLQANAEPSRTADLKKAIKNEIAALRARKWRPERTDYLECRLLLLDRDWAKAAEQLEALRPRLLGSADLLKEVDLLLAACHARVGNPERRIESLQRAVAADPLSETSRIALAEALRDAGRLDEAINEYARARNAPGALYERARLVLIRELHKPADRRDLDVAEAAVKEAEQAAPGDPGVVKLRARLLTARGDYAAADDLLVEAAETATDASDLWHMRFLIAAGREDATDAERVAAAESVLDAGRERYGDTVEFRLAEAELTRLRSPESLPEVIVRLSSETEGLEPEDEVRLYEGLVRYAKGLKGETARELWRKVVSLRKDSIQAWLAMAQFAADAQDEKGVQEALDEVRRIEGDGGPNGDFVEAIWRLSRITQDTELRADRARLEQELERPRELLSRAAKNRKDWPAVPRALGLMESLIGNTQAATGHFRRAYDLGDRSVEVVRGVAQGYLAEDKPDAAAAVIRESARENPAVMTGDLLRLASQVATQRGNLDEAIDQAARAAALSRDVRDRIRHADLVFAKYRTLPQAERESDEGKRLLEEAGTLLRQLVDNSPERREAWLAYILYLRMTGNDDDARSVVAEAEGKLPSEPAYVRPHTLAWCYSLLGDAEKAAEFVRKAVEAAPKEAGIRLDAANLLVQAGEVAEANQHLAWLLDPAHEVPAATAERARWLRAVATAATGRHEDLLKALETLDRRSAGDEVPVEDLRAQIRLLASRTSLGDQRRLISILETIRDRAGLAPEERFTPEEKLHLVALYEATGDWGKAKPILEEMVRADRTNPDYVAALILGGLRHEMPSGNMARAELERDLRSLLDRLQALESGSARTMLTVVEFEARFGRAQQAETILTDYVKQFDESESRGGATLAPQERSEIRTFATRAEELRLVGAAEHLLERLSKDPVPPTDTLLLAAFLGRQGRYDEALRLVEERPSGCPPVATAMTAVSIVSTGRPTPEQLARAEVIVEEAAMTAPGTTQMMNLLAGLRLAQSRFDESEAIYRRIIAENPADVSAMNNLAWLLVAADKDDREAERLINEAIAIAGPLPELIDTRGMIRYAQGHYQDALGDLQDAFIDSRTASAGFHLALVHEALGRREAARQALRKAHELGLGVDRLHLTEHKTYERLLQRLGERGT